LATSAEQFVRDFVVRPFRPSHIVEGPSFGFGAGRRGNADTLKVLGRSHGFETHVVGPEMVDLGPPEGRMSVCSSLIRRLVAGGAVDKARRCLGRPFALVSCIVPGAAKGRDLGYPTINLEDGGQQLPGDGVYAGWAWLDAVRLAAAVSVGSRPTFGGTARVVEAFLLDHAGTHYGEFVRLEFLRRLRDQRAFSSGDALALQIARDVDDVRRITAEETVHAE
ncbi:MAG: riboflavin kinase, partial [Phycisphaerae bacterium]